VQICKVGCVPTAPQPSFVAPPTTRTGSWAAAEAASVAAAWPKSPGVIDSGAGLELSGSAVSAGSVFAL
jgi:hypothetical protein